MDITPSGQTLGACITGIDLARPLDDSDVRNVLRVHGWTVGDVLMWDNIGTVHNAVGDYTADEPRYMRRVQVMAILDYPRLVA